MKLKSWMANLRKYRSLAKWPTLVTSSLLVVINYIIESRFVDFSQGGVHDTTPPLLGMLYAGLFLLTLLLAIFTLLRWYSFVAFAAMLWVFLVFVGR
jgi:hypothetical protein